MNTFKVMTQSEMETVNGGMTYLPTIFFFLSVMIHLLVKMEIPSPAVRSSGLPLPAHCFDTLLS